MFKLPSIINQPFVNCKSRCFRELLKNLKLLKCKKALSKKVHASWGPQTMDFRTDVFEIYFETKSPFIIT